ncbi:MAG: hypothetical protein ACJ8H8_34290 [Geminicoccaceae bacterium]
MVKNAKEMMANERELQNTRKSAAERQEEVLKLVESLETAKKSVATHEADLEALRKHVSDEEEASKSKIAEFDKQIGEERKLREVAAARVEQRIARAPAPHAPVRAPNGGSGRRAD